jgi:hypothetical protein
VEHRGGHFQDRKEKCIPKTNNRNRNRENKRNVQNSNQAVKKSYTDSVEQQKLSEIKLIK